MLNLKFYTHTMDQVWKEKDVCGYTKIQKKILIDILSKEKCLKIYSNSIKKESKKKKGGHSIQEIETLTQKCNEKKCKVAIMQQVQKAISLRDYSSSVVSGCWMKWTERE